MPAARPLVGTLLVCLLLSACAKTGPVDFDRQADFDRRMATYVAGPEAQLVSALGVPQRVYETEGRRFLQYEFAGEASTPTVSPGIGLGFASGGWGRGVGTGIGIGFGGGGGYQIATCSVTFEVRDNRVLNFERHGEGCR